MHLPAARPIAALVAALALGGCGTSGYGTVDAHQLVLIPTARPASAAGRRTDAALVCGARVQARRLHHALRVARPRTGSASSQIAVANAVTAKKPGGVVIVPGAGNAMLAPILSMRRAGIRVVRLSPPLPRSGHSPPGASRPRGSPADHPAEGAAAAEGARAVATVVRAMGPRRRGARAPAPASLLAPCASAP